MMTTIAACLFICLPATAQGFRNQISLSLDPLHHPGTIKADISHQITRHWSAGWAACIRLPKLHTPDEEEAKHDEEFEDESQLSHNKWAEYGALGVRYWPQIPHEGAYVSAGARFNSKGKITCTIGLGYIMKIYKHVSLMACYEKCLDNEEADNGEIGLGLCINF